MIYLNSFVVPLLALQVVSSQEPVPPDRWEQSVSARCGRNLLRISGYGPAIPVSQQVEITINGQQVVGESVSALRRDLGNRRAAYRVAVRCSRAESQILVYLYTGEASGGQVSYRSGLATFIDGSLRGYSGLEPSNSETFWFR